MNRKSSILSLPGRALRALAPISLLCLFAFLALFSATALAQLSGQGAISGTVEDSTGAAIPHATVVITSARTGVATTTTSTSDGNYNVSTLDPGTYTITVSASGFEKLTQKNVQVNALETVTLNPKLPVGASDQSVTVTAAPPQLDTTNAQLGATMDNEMYSALPISMGAYGSPDQRRATDFELLMPGVQGNETNGNPTDNTGPVDGSGSRGAATAVYIDGLPFTNVAGEGDPRYVWTAISVDAVNQFQLETTGYSALYEGQGVLNFTVKQGGDRYHGGVYEFFRNTALDTWGFFQVKSNLTGLPIKPVEHQNEYGISLSGPLVPFGKWRDKVFAFGNYDGYRYSKINPTYVTFPNAAEQAGNFQGIQPIYDPNTQTGANGAQNCTANSTTGTCRYRYGYVYGGTPGPAGNPVLGPGGAAAVDQIPLATEASAVALKMQSFIPALANQNLANNYVSPNPNGLVNWSMTDRIDYIVNSKDTLSFVAALGRQGSSSPVGQTTAGRNVAAVPYNYGQAYAPKTAVGFIEETHVFTDHLVNQLKYGFARYDSYDFNVDQVPAYSAATMGITGLPAGQAAGSFPETTFAGIDPVEQWAGYNGSVNIGNSYILLDNVQWVHKNHNITIGGELGWMQYNQINDTGGTSTLDLANAVTETSGFTNATTLTPSTGDSYASFLLGQIDKASLTQNIVPETGARFRPISPYIQDNWKVSSRLTVDLGLRWDYYPPYHEVHNVLSFFNPTLTNPVTNSPGAIQYAGSGANTCNCTTPVSPYYKNLGPRIGFAFQSDPRTVWRGSYGVMYTHGNGIGGSAISRTGTGTLGFSAAPAFSSSTSTFLSTAPLQGGFPAYTPATGVASGNAYGTGYTTTANYTGTPSSLGYADPYYGARAPQYINYTFGMQHQWTNSFTSTISYAGSQGHFLITDGGNPRGYWADQLDPKYLPLNNCLGAAISKLGTTAYAPDPAETCTAAVANFGATVPSWFSTSQSLSTALMPFPQYKVSDSYGNVANASYNALQVSLMQRPARGVSFMINYTWSRSIDDAGTFRTGYAIPASVSNNGKSWAADRIERGVSTTNQPQHLVFTGVEDLPFGRGSLGGGHAWSRALLGGFKFSQILQLYSGSPLAIYSSAGQTNPAGGSGGSATSPIEPMLNPGFIGNAHVNGRWGKGSTSTNLLSYIATSGPTACNVGPFIAPTSACLAPYAYTFGNAPRTAPYGLTGQGNFDLDISLRRTFNLHLTDASKFSLQADMYNVTNYVLFAAPSLDLGSSTFGEPGGSQANNSRDVQLSARLDF